MQNKAPSTKYQVRRTLSWVLGRSKYDIAPTAALLTAGGATNGTGKLRLYLFLEAVRTFTELTVGSLVFDSSLSTARCVWEWHEYSLPHTVFSSAFSLAMVQRSVKLQLDRSLTIQVQID